MKRLVGILAMTILFLGCGTREVSYKDQLLMTSDMLLKCSEVITEKTETRIIFYLKDCVEQFLGMKVPKVVTNQITLLDESFLEDEE